MDTPGVSSGAMVIDTTQGPFGVFAFVIYPNREFFHPTVETIASLQAQFPSLHWPLALLGVWSYAVFYVLAELWGSALVSLSFWQFANQITRVSEAKRMYAFFGLMAQVSLLLAGVFGDYFSNVKDKIAQTMMKKYGRSNGFLIYSSKAELELVEFCKQYFTNTIQNDRKLIFPYELDIVIPNINLAIEFNGIWYHSIEARNHVWLSLNEDRNV